MGLIRNVTLDRAARKKDGSVSLTFITQTEQTSAEFMEIDSLLNDGGAIHFKSNGNLNQKEIEALEKVEFKNEGKSKSQRMRSVLFILYSQTGKEVSFNDFYSDEMERIIEHYKQKLD